MTDSSTRCVCGHPLEEHHVSYFPGGGMWADECEAYGWNESGGTMPVHPGETEACPAMMWSSEDDHGVSVDDWVPCPLEHKRVDHCHQFKEAK